MMASTTDVLVVGAGPTGLTMANLLAYHNINVRILDKRAGPTEETRALVMHARILELLDKLGLAEQAINEGQKLRAAELLARGKRFGKLSFQGEEERTPYPFALIYTQDQTEHLLQRNLEKTTVRVEWNTELLNLEQTSNGIRATVRQTNGSEEIIEAGWIVGADGAHSPVRHALSLGFEGESYKQALFLADLELEGDLNKDQLSIGFTKLGFLAFFPMHGERRFRVVSTLPLEFTNRETLTPDEIQQVINTYRGPYITIKRAHWISVYRIHHRMSKRFRVGNVFLVGDAAHIHSPAGGQGMNTGIGDAYNLAWKLALVIKGQAQTTLLDSYEDERMPFARAILNGSDKGFELMTMSQPLVQQLKVSGLPRLFRFVSSVPALRQRAFWLLSQLWTSYRSSSAVMQSAAPEKKRVQAGDRAPYGIYEIGPDTGKSIFSTLGGLDHHLLLFAGSDPGTASSNLQEIASKVCKLVSTYAAPIHVHIVEAGNRRLHQRYEANTPALFLVRPDGHIAYRGSAEDSARLEAYLDRIFNKEVPQPGIDSRRASSSQLASTGEGE
ncbi:oxygenase [Dictyobacter alpinus]|uniref:Oxygenase n=1 Tax=Dictyobacter alpinus TaxID=2014873 RepID=A0A402BA97_9CHLR|nr:FAD-dependent monooxygenase [Dictyobacter alpinus]GCE28301.1 oxygenase [Dictyobacter alpinus]